MSLEKCVFLPGLGDDFLRDGEERKLGLLDPVEYDLPASKW